MTKRDVQKTIEEESLIFAYNLLEDRADNENEIVIKADNDHYIVYQTDENAQIIGNPVIIINESEALDAFLNKLRAIKTKKYEHLLCSNGAIRILRETTTKTFISRYDFEATYHELYKSNDEKYFSVLRIDPAPGGYGEEFTYIKDVYKLDINFKGQSYSDEDLLQLVFSKGEKIGFEAFNSVRVTVG